jgi:hypothetical protein
MVRPRLDRPLYRRRDDRQHQSQKYRSIVLGQRHTLQVRITTYRSQGESFPMAVDLKTVLTFLCLTNGYRSCHFAEIMDSAVASIPEDWEELRVVWSATGRLRVRSSTGFLFAPATPCLIRWSVQNIWLLVDLNRCEKVDEVLRQRRETLRSMWAVWPSDFTSSLRTSPTPTYDSLDLFFL